jgi:hypothetical protein
MAAAETHTAESPERERVERWRAELLERAGYDARGAAEVATRQDIDLHFAIDLLEQGCSPELALKILL